MRLEVMVDGAQELPHGGPFYLGFDYAPARRPYTYDVFISSSSEVADLRDDVERLITHSFDPALAGYADAQLNVVRWEQALANRLGGETVNETFVRTAVACHHTLVLLMTHLGPGTREEVEAVIREGRPISIIRFDAPDGHESEFDPSEISEFLNGFGKPLLWEACGPPGTSGAWESLSKTLAGIALGAYRKYLMETTPALTERRD